MKTQEGMLLTFPDNVRKMCRKEVGNWQKLFLALNPEKPVRGLPIQF